MSSERTTEYGEQAMIAGILEGCGCRKMAAVSLAGEPASKIIMYRDQAQSICDQCSKDQGHALRVLEQFIHWKKPAPSLSVQNSISEKVLGPAH